MAVQLRFLPWALLMTLGCHAPHPSPPDGAPPAPPDLTLRVPEDGPAPPDLATPDLRRVPDHPDLTKLVPWKGVNLAGPTDLVWEEYDYRPKAQGGFKEDIDTRLEQLKALGVRQVAIQTWYAWSVENATYPGSPIQSIVYYQPGYDPANPATWGKVPRTRRGDMGLVAYQPPASWDQPTPLRTPLDINQKAESVLGQMLDAVAAHGLIPVLKSEVYLELAEDGSSISGDFNYTDPSRDFDQFYAMFQDYLLSMTRVAAQHQAALLVLGVEVPYVAGAGQSYFIDGSKMTDRASMIAGKWQGIIQAVRAAARAQGRPDLALTYAEINPWDEERKTSEPKVAIWTRVPFWDQLDAVGIDFYLPGRYVGADGSVDTSPKTVDDMITYEETHNFKTDTIGNYEDLENFFSTQKGYTLTTRPVLFIEDGCTASPSAAANPALPPFLRLRTAPDLAEQQKLFEAHFRLFLKHGGNWLAGFSFWQATPTLRWGGPYVAGNTDNYSEADAYFNFVGNPAGDTVKQYFSMY